MSFTLCTSGAIVIKAGADVNATAAASGTILTLFCDMAEAQLSTITGIDWVSVYSDVGTNYKPILADAVSCLAGNMLIAYDLSGYPSSTKAQTLMSFNDDNYTRCVSLLREADRKSLLGV